MIHNVEAGVERECEMKQAESLLSRLLWRVSGLWIAVMGVALGFHQGFHRDEQPQ